VNRYAEHHYRFQLPWSPLHRARPEMIVDAPSLVAAGREIPLWLVVHDAHRFPRRLREVRVVVRAGGELRRLEKSFDLELSQPFHFVPLPFPEATAPGETLVDVIFRVEDRAGNIETFRNHSLPGLPPTPLKILRLATEFPFPKGWVSGDLHCHTHWSQDPVEFGADPAVLRDAAAAMGMDFFAASDHSYDFAWDSPDYMVPTDPEAAFARFRASLPADAPGLPTVLPAEEVSCGNSRGQNVHLLVIDHPEYLPGQGDGGRRWFRNRPDLSLAQVLERTAASGAPTFAAHPRPGIGWLERLVFRRGEFREDDMLPGLTGLQFWNGHTGRDFREGRELWLRQNLSGTRLRPAAGNDAHGDLNRSTGVRLPLFKLSASRKHRFGHARTWLFLGEDAATDRAALREALKAAPCLLSDGPFLWIDSQARLSARSLPDFGGWSEIVVWARIGNAEVEVLRETSTALELHRRLEVPAGALWLRAEGRTVLGRTAMTEMVALE